MRSRTLWVVGAGLGLLALGFAAHAYRNPMDYRVYYYGARGVFEGARPVYGPSSGMGWPMHYRYPPLFLLLFTPFAGLSLAWGAAIWTLLKCAVLVLLVPRIWSHLGPSANRSAWVIPLLLAGPYVVEDLRYGNAQLFVFALVAAALLYIKPAPVWSAGALAMAIILKVWPLFFVPYLAARREWKVVGWTLAFTVALAALPSTHFGISGNLNLLRQWQAQELATQSADAEIWFPSQSLRGVMMRYLTVVDYSRVPDSNYPVVHFAAMDPAVVRNIWIGLAAIGYCGLLVVARRWAHQDTRLSDALAFAALPLLEPFTQKYALVVLLLPAMAAGRAAAFETPFETRRWLLYAAIAFAIAQPLMMGSSAQRLMQALGFDFAVTAFLIAFILFSLAVYRPATTETYPQD